MCVCGVGGKGPWARDGRVGVRRELRSCAKEEGKGGVKKEWGKGREGKEKEGKGGGSSMLWGDTERRRRRIRRRMSKDEGLRRVVAE